MLIQCVFIDAKTFLININLLMIRVGGIFSLGFLSQNVAQLSFKRKLDLTRKGCAYITLLVLVMLINSQVSQRAVPIYHFECWGRTAREVLLSVR